MDRWKEQLKIEGDGNVGFLRPVIWRNTKEEEERRIIEIVMIDRFLTEKMIRIVLIVSVDYWNSR